MVDIYVVIPTRLSTSTFLQPLVLIILQITNVLNLWGSFAGSLVSGAKRCKIHKTHARYVEIRSKCMHRIT